MSAVLADRDAPCHHLVAPGRRTLSLPLRLLRPNHRQEQQLERPYPPANQQPPRQAVARSPAFANQLHPHVTAAAAWTFHAKHTLSFVDLHPLYRMYAAFAITFPAFRTAHVERVEVRPFHAIGMGRRLSSEKRIGYIRIRSWMYFLGVTRRSCPFIAARYSPAFLPNRALAAQTAAPKARPSEKSLLLY